MFKHSFLLVFQLTLTLLSMPLLQALRDVIGINLLSQLSLNLTLIGVCCALCGKGRTRVLCLDITLGHTGLQL